jgi:hypothetical protein
MGTQCNSENISHVASIYADISNFANPRTKLDIDQDVYKQSLSNFAFMCIAL